MLTPLQIITSCAALAITVCGCAPLSPPPAGAPVQAETWRFDSLETIGGARVRVEGDPALVASEHGVATAFDGEADALFVEAHPLAGAEHFTAEAIFRPRGGAFEQRWMHLAEAADTPDGAYPPVAANGPRMLFEIRVVADEWYLDTFVAGPGYSQALIDPAKRFPVGRWYHVAHSYDGKTYRSYVDGVLQAEATIAFRPQGAGYASIGTRINRRSYFNGDVLAARFTRAALTPDQFMPLPQPEE